MRSHGIAPNAATIKSSSSRIAKFECRESKNHTSKKRKASAFPEDNTTADDEETLIRTMSVTGQLHVFQVARKSMLARLNWDRVDAGRIESLKRVLREHSTVLLHAMVKARDAGRRMDSRRPAARLKRKRVAGAA